MYEEFRARAEAAGATVHRFFQADEALEFVLQQLPGEGVAPLPGLRAVLAPGALLEGWVGEALKARVPGLELEVTRELAREARVGITRMDWGIADTGTLVQDSTAVEQRLASSLPWTHIALLSTGSLVPDLATLLTRVDPEHSAYLAFITGPSRTADIERVLAIGVHGPERLVIVCIDALAEVAP